MSTTRKVQVFSTKGKRSAVIETDATKWSELRNLVENEGYDVGKLHATESINRTDLAHNDAALPEGEFTLFLRPMKTKSGIEVAEGLSFKQLRAIAKELKQKDGDKFIDFLNANDQGVNWTRLSGADLAERMRQYGNDEAEEVEATESATPAPEMNNAMRMYIIKDMLTEVGENTKDEFLEVRCDDLIEEVEELEGMVTEEDGPTDNVAELAKAALGAGNTEKVEELESKISKLEGEIENLEGQLAKKKEEKSALENEAEILLKGF